MLSVYGTKFTVFCKFTAKSKKFYYIGNYMDMQGSQETVLFKLFQNMKVSMPALSPSYLRIIISISFHHVRIHVRHGCLRLPLCCSATVSDAIARILVVQPFIFTPPICPFFQIKAHLTQSNGISLGSNRGGHGFLRASC